TETAVNILPADAMLIGVSSWMRPLPGSLNAPCQMASPSLAISTLPANRPSSAAFLIARARHPTESGPLHAASDASAIAGLAVSFAGLALSIGAPDGTDEGTSTGDEPAPAQPAS